MTSILETLLIWAERQLPESRRIWVSDLRAEARHISGRLARQRFLWSGAAAALGLVLRLQFGVQRVGQTLLGLAIFAFCFGGLVIGPSIESAVVKQTFYAMLPIYALTGGLALLSLNVMRRFTAGCILVLGLFSIISGLGFFTSMDAPIWFFRAFAIESAVVMAGLFTAASYLEWIKDDNHA